MNANDADHPETEQPAAPAVEGAEAHEAAKRPPRKRAPRKKPVAEASSGAVDVVLPLADPEPAPRVESSVETSTTTSDAAPHDAAHDPAAGSRPEGSRRGRNRRRGRRGGGDRGERSDRPPLPVDGEAQALADDDRDDETDGQANPAVAADPPLPMPLPAEVFAEVLSGAYDAEPAAEETATAPKRVLAADPDAPKLHKVLAQAGVGSRRDLEQMIVEGQITVNGQAAHIGQRISFGDRINVGGKPVRYRISPPPPRVLAYHKPAGEVVTHDDPQQRPTVFRKLPRLPQGKWQSVGRLDINTEGLLLFTNSGELANQLMHPRFGVEREYAVRSLGMLAVEAKAKLLEGVEIEGQRAAFKSIEDGGGEGANHWYRVVITEGRNREVRRLFEAVGHAVSRLIRIRYGSVVLPRGLKRGVWTDLAENDVRTLRRITGTDRPPARQGDQTADSQRRKGRSGRGGRGGRDGRETREGGGPDRPMQVERGPRPPRQENFDRPERGERGEGGPIPNPLQQTFDRRAIQQARSARREPSEDGPIPNPLQQTYDKRALQNDRAPRHDVPDDDGPSGPTGPIPNPLQQTFDKRFAPQNQRRNNGGGGGGQGGQGGRRGGGGGGNRGGNAGDNRGGGGGERQPDPMQTSAGYIGADAFLRKGPGGGRGGRGRSGGGGNNNNGGGRGGPRR